MSSQKGGDDRGPTGQTCPEDPEHRRAHVRAALHLPLAKCPWHSSRPFCLLLPSCGIGTPALLDIAVRTVVSPAGRLRFLRRRDRSIGGPGREGRGGGRRMGVPDVRRAGSRGRWMGRARLYYWQTDDCCACVIVFLPTRGAFHDKTRLPHGRYGSRASWRRTLKRC